MADLRAVKSASPPRQCSFCGKAEHEVSYLLQGPAAGICDECVELAANIIREKRMASGSGDA